MIEKVILDYLKTQNVDAYMEIPKETPDMPFVVIEKTGSSVENRIMTSTIAIQSYGSSLYNAATLNATIISLMENAESLSSISRVRLNSDYNFTDTSTKRYRYQAVFDITHY